MIYSKCRVIRVVAESAVSQQFIELDLIGQISKYAVIEVLAMQLHACICIEKVQLKIIRANDRKIVGYACK
jgi:hypothetical protein